MPYHLKFSESVFLKNVLKCSQLPMHTHVFFIYIQLEIGALLSFYCKQALKSRSVYVQYKSNIVSHSRSGFESKICHFIAVLHFTKVLQLPHL